MRRVRLNDGQMREEIDVVVAVGVVSSKKKTAVVSRTFAVGRSWSWAMNSSFQGKLERQQSWLF